MLLPRVRHFAAIVTEADLHGLAFQHLALCRRRAWLHLHRIDYSHLDVRMQRGLAMHDASKPRDRSVVGLMGLATVIRPHEGSGVPTAVLGRSRRCWSSVPMRGQEVTKDTINALLENVIRPHEGSGATPPVRRKRLHQRHPSP